MPHHKCPHKIPVAIYNQNQKLYFEWQFLIKELHATDLRALLKPIALDAKQQPTKIKSNS